ncbi:MAG: methyltransferase domain-containing protein [Crocinitomicaceae bacterium]|nr:methyltransferase domain-containing protein [Crocinitomicaceae bacterium]
MNLKNGQRIEEQISKNDLVLDIGGWWQPFPRADYVVDVQPYETRNQGNTPFLGEERFTKDTWIVADVNSKLPFQDKQFDFVICSHVVEDIRDPIWLLKEISRVGKAGYIEFPSRFYESIRGLEQRGYVGLYHHRWLVCIENGNIVFRHKPHSIHGKKKYSIARRNMKKLTAENSIDYIFWDNKINGIEQIDLSMDSVNYELAQFAKMHTPRLIWFFREICDWDNIKIMLKQNSFFRSSIEKLIRRKLRDNVHIFEKYDSK